MKVILNTTAILITVILFLFFDLMSNVQAQHPPNKFGILDQNAPELTSVEHWVDENGKPVNRILLSEYKGKIIYMIFFQDW